MPDTTGVIFHFAASISWYYKGPLIFYNDEHEPPPVEVKKPSKPRRRPKTETAEQYQQRLKEWEASLPHDPEIKPKGNAMTQAYYTEKLLPGYIRTVHEHRINYGRGILQEDNDPSHGTRSAKNLAQELKARNWIEVLVHPAQSPDLNPSEGCWNILKQRVRRRRGWRNKAELKQVLLEEWDRITMEEIRARIAEMPSRCKQLVATGGKGIKSSLW